MALIKEYITKGYEYKYWMISSFNASKIAKRTTVNLWLYKDKESREESIYNDILNLTVEIKGYVTDVTEIYDRIKKSFTDLDEYEEIEDDDEFDGPVRVKFFADAKDDL